VFDEPGRTGRRRIAERSPRAQEQWPWAGQSVVTWSVSVTGVVLVDGLATGISLMANGRGGELSLRNLAAEGWPAGRGTPCSPTVSCRRDCTGAACLCQRRFDPFPF